jgi:transposase-like protein
MRGDRRHCWSFARKRAIVAANLAPNAAATVIARQHGIGTEHIYTWHEQLLGRRPVGRRALLLSN